MRMLALLKPGGRLVYSTCSIEPAENIQLVKAVLKEAPGWTLLEDKLLLPHRDHVDGAYGGSGIFASISSIRCNCSCAYSGETGLSFAGFTSVRNWKVMMR